MKNLIRSLLIAVLFAPVIAAAEPLFSVNLGDPGYFGRIDIGNDLRPRLIYDEPRIIERSSGGRPLYLHVPPGHAKDWGKHCKHYNACARPVYFVDNGWYEKTYAPAYRSKHGHSKSHNKNKNNDNDKKNGKSKGNDKH